MLSTHDFSRVLFSEFPYSPTPGQQELINRLASFIISKRSQFPFFMLQGYAGTGKTTVVSTLVKVLPMAGYSAVLLAPTGRAAKVLSNYSGMPAYTIHKRIYRLKADAEGKLAFNLMPNRNSNTIFIVDEASMIPGNTSSDKTTFQYRNLLDDLIEHVYTGENCKLLFLGDSCQLPPVGETHSPALNIELLKSSYYLDTETYTLQDVVRQALESGILQHATDLRYKILNSDNRLPLFRQENKWDDVISITGTELPEAMHQAYSDYGRENTVLITRSNKRANLFNKAIRERILFHETELAAGDHLMVVKNNYFWLPEESKAGFIANGDIAELLSIRKTEELYGFRFADVTLRLIDYPDESTLDAKLLINTLDSETPALNYEEQNHLFQEVMADYRELSSRKKQLAALRTNPYYNALQVKHANALTCHKTQGGQWDAVFLEKGFLKEEMIDTEYLRWLYTAITRAEKKLFLVNFDDNFFS